MPCCCVIISYQDLYHKNNKMRNNKTSSSNPRVLAYPASKVLSYFFSARHGEARVACEQALELNWEPASMTNEFEYLPRNVRFSKYGMSTLICCCLQLSCKLNLDCTVYTVFRNIRYSSKSLNVLNTVFSKQNISCFEIRWPRPIWSVSVFFMHI
jgi:hypothetical protein